MKHKVEQFIQRYSICSQIKHHIGPLLGLPHPLSTLIAPWHDVSVDLVTRMPLVKGFNAMCTVVNRLSKEIVVFPISNATSSQELAILFCDKVWS